MTEGRLGHWRSEPPLLYVRVSTDAQPVENQIHELSHVDEHRGWQVVEIYGDAGISGAKGRDQWPRRHAQGR